MIIFLLLKCSAVMLMDAFGNADCRRRAVVTPDIPAPRTVICILLGLLNRLKYIASYVQQKIT